MENNNANIFNTFAEAQKQAAETFANATEKMAKSLNLDMNSDFFKKWYDSQMSFFNQNAGENNIGNMNFFNTWMTSQMNTAKEWMGNFPNNFTNMTSNNMFNANMTDEMKKSYEQMMNIYNSWTGSMNNTYSEMVKNFGNTNTKDAFTGMFNNAEMYMKVFEFWMPMLKSIQDKTFTPELFKNMFNAPLHKEIMDKIFNMQPDFMKGLMSNDAIKENMAKMMGMNKEMFNNMKNMMPNNTEMFGNMYSQYNNMLNTLNQSSAPLMKMMPAGAMKNNMETMNEMANEFGGYQMKNTQMQYMMYTTGMEAMYEVAEKTYAKIQNGEDMSNFTNIYSDFLNTSDVHFVKLFSTEEYSKMQAELNSFGMKLKRNMDLQLEKTLSNVPVATRTEMDELYKTIYELKKRINTLEKQLDSDAVEVVEEKEPKARKSAKNA